MKNGAVKSVLGLRLKKLMKDHDETCVSMGVLLKYTRGTVSSWCNGRSEPNIETLIRIARHFDVSIDYLVGND